MRRLVSIRRMVGGDRLDGYDAAWSVLVDSARERNANAWRFRSTVDPNLFIEFLEFPESSDPRESPAFNKALLAVESLAAGITEEWKGS